jgi:hypothetical protein
MRWFAYLFIFLGLVFVADAIYDELRGVAEAVFPGRVAAQQVVVRAENPKQFRNLMTYQWGRGLIGGVAGCLILAICRGSDRLDPFSADFAGLDSVPESTGEPAQEREAGGVDKRRR